MLRLRQSVVDTLNQGGVYIFVPRNLTLWRYEYYSHSFFTLVGQTMNLRNLHLYYYFHVQKGFVMDMYIYC